jgi:hypothetical protein
LNPHRHTWAFTVAATALLVCGACGEPSLHGSDADMEQAFHGNQFELFQPELLRDGKGIAYKQLSSNWYLFFRQE